MGIGADTSFIICVKLVIVLTSAESFHLDVSDCIYLKSSTVNKNRKEGLNKKINY